MNNSAYLPAITGLRIIAAWVVFFHHFPPIENEKSFLFAFFKEGYIGVSLFFVLSGFLIAYKYYDNDLFDLKRYYFLRLVRVYPIFWITVTMTFLILAFYKPHTGYTWQNYWLNVSFLKGFSDKYKFTGVSQTWSLTVEECFYLIAPFLFYLHRRYSFFWISLLLIYTLGAFLLMLDLQDWFENLHFVIFYTFFGRCFEFFAGFGLYLWFLNRPKNVMSPNILTLLGIFGVLAIWLTFGYVNYRHYLLNKLLEVLLQNYLLPLLIVTIMAGLITEKTIFSKLLNLPFMQLLGKSSYVFYLIHIGILSKIMSIIGYWPYFLFINSVSIGLYWYLERVIYLYLRQKMTS
jgi:peptidoglycan/LPS O-acetylase OafA/YrhL